MAFLKESKRKISAATPINDDNIVNINLKDMFITDGHSTANFERLLYKGCPVLPMEGRRIYKPKKQPALIDANRKELAVKICNAIHGMDKTKRTKINIFYETIFFIKMADSYNIKNIFSVEFVSLYIKKLTDGYKNKEIKGSTLSSRQSSIKNLLIETDTNLYEKCKHIFISFPSDTEHVKPYTDNELKKIAHSLYAIYNDYSRHVELGTTPDKFPLDEKRNNHRSYITKDSTTLQKKVKYKNNVNLWKTDLVRTAFLITCFYTGANANPLLDLKISDIDNDPFMLISRSSYNLRTIKGRQSGKKNDIRVGFTKKSKIFFERWIEISKKLNSYEDGYLFPNLSGHEPSKLNSSNVNLLNRYFVKIGLPPLISKRFRKTKASLIMRATESIFKVAQGLNNSVETTLKHYSDGNPVTTEFSLASALYIREQTALGVPLDRAIEKSSFLFKDPLKGIDADNNFKKISNGLRCKGAFKEESIKIKKSLIQEGLAKQNDIVACHKFLECFGCMHHAIVAEVNDIWLLLSFNDIIMQAATRPSINSTPSDLLNKVHNTIHIIIEKMKIEHKSVYQKAYNKYLESPHPLWGNDSDLELILGVY